MSFPYPARTVAETDNPAPHIFADLDALSRQRALTEDESLALEQALITIDAKRRAKFTTPWAPEEDRDFFEAIANGASIAEASRVAGKSTGAGAGRFDRVRRHYGWQAG